MRISVKIDGIEFFRKIVDEKTFERASRRTIRRMGQRFRKRAVSEAMETYNVRSKKLKKHIRAKTHETKQGTEYRFNASGKRLSLVNFGARQTRKGVSVKVRKDRGRKLIKGAFLARGVMGNLQLFERVGAERLPIVSKKTISVPQMFNKEILEKAKKEVEANFDKEFKHNLYFYMGKL